MHDCIGSCSIADVCSTCVCDRNRQVCMKLLDLHKHKLCTVDDGNGDEIKGNRCVVRCVTCALISKLPTREKRAQLHCSNTNAKFTIQQIWKRFVHYILFHFIFDRNGETYVFHFYCSIIWLKFYGKITFRALFQSSFESSDDNCE